MGLAMHRNTETGELIELSEDWMTRFPRDPYELVSDEDLERLATEQRQATAKAAGALPYQPPDDYTGDAAIVPPSSEHGDGDDDEDTHTPAPNPRSESRF